MIDYAAQKEKLFKMFSKDDLSIIKRDYPNRKIRNAKIREIIQNGFSYKLISDLTGLSYSVVWNIGLSTPNANKLTIKGLIKMKTAIDALSQEISIIINDESKNR
jgi:hypothetical protein